MNQRRLKLLIIFVLIILPITSCSTSSNDKVDELKSEVELLKQNINQYEALFDKINSLESELEELNLLKSQVVDLEQQLKDTKTELKDLKENINEYEAYYNFTDLSSFESYKFEEFRQNYDNDILIGLEPLSVFKMFLHAKYIEDYETQYELFTENPEYVTVSKEDFLKEPQDRIPVSKEIFEDVYEINGIAEYDEEHVYISWKSKNGYIDESAGAFAYGFALQKDGEVWKVSFNPMN